MTYANPSPDRSRWLRIALAAVLVAVLAVGVYLVWPSRTGDKVVGYFTSTVGLYPGDDVRIVGVPVGKIDSIEPRASDVKVTMTLHDGVKVPADAKALVISPNLVSARFIQLAPAYTGGPSLSDGASIGLDRTAVPVEWDEVKEQLSALSRELGPQQGGMQGPLSSFVNQAADTFDGNGDSFREALRELSQTAGRLGDSRTDLFGTIRNLQVLINALSNSNEQIVQFTGHVASVSQVLADSTTDLDNTLGTLNQALGDVKGFLNESNDALIGQVNKLTDFTSILTEHSDDIEQILHITPNGLANFYNIYNPAQGTVGGLLTLAELRQPGAVHLRRCVRRRYIDRQLQARRIVQAANGTGAASHHDELPAAAVPPDQQHHRLQGPDHLRHTANRGEGGDAGALSAVAVRTRSERAEAVGRNRPEFADGAAANSRHHTQVVPKQLRHPRRDQPTRMHRLRRRPRARCRPREVGDAQTSAGLDISCRPADGRDLCGCHAARRLFVRRAELARHAGYVGARLGLVQDHRCSFPTSRRCRRIRR